MANWPKWKCEVTSLGNLLNLAKEMPQLRAAIFDRMFEVCKQEDFSFLQSFLINPQKLIDTRFLTNERRFDYLQLAMGQARSAEWSPNQRP